MKSLLLYIIPVSFLLLIFSSCQEGKTELPPSFAGSNLSVETIENNIIALETTDWVNGRYEEILINQIQAATELNDQDKSALTKLLREKYADQIVRCSDSIMTNACAASHAKLDTMMLALTQVESQLLNNYHNSSIEAFKKRKATHDEMLKFYVASKYGNAVNEYSSYDYSYDRERKSTASNYRNQHPTCSEINEKINASTVERKLKARRSDFENKLEKAQREAYYNYY